MFENYLLVLAGSLVGFIVGLTGVGGGALMTPLLLLGFNVAPVTAIATDLLFATITKIVSVPVHHRQGSIDWRAAKVVWSGSIPGLVLGIVLVMTVFESHSSVIYFVMAFVVSLTAISMFFGHDLSLNPSSSRAVGSAGGAVIGLLVASTSVGAGALGMTIFRSLIGRGSSKNLVGTDTVHAIPLALLAGAAYFLGGFVDLQLLVLLLFGSVPGVLIGARISSVASGKYLRVLLSFVLFLAALGMIGKGLGA